MSLIKGGETEKTAKNAELSYSRMDKWLWSRKLSFVAEILLKVDPFFKSVAPDAQNRHKLHIYWIQTTKRSQDSFTCSPKLSLSQMKQR